ncbi:cell division topological specificity factor MinE [Nitratifractor sp.]|uniref:cell division topological specificity factor MinE n=1 Tax=Nitratifractor sp. TaxID=2268144 RepID=UPI0025FE4468|nr:cell division topological specificity factor MinE [Nitratifractor sp.]
MFPWFNKKKKNSASVAKDRLKIAIMSDRTGHELPYMEDLKRDIIEVIKKYKEVSNIEIRKVSHEDTDAIAIEVELEEHD